MLIFFVDETRRGGQSALRIKSKRSMSDRVCRLWVIDLYREHAGRDYPKYFGKSLYKLRAQRVAPATVSTQWKNVEGNKRNTMNWAKQHYTRRAGNMFKRERLTRIRAERLDK